MYYSEWLTAARRRDLVGFCIPYSPETLSASDLKTGVAEELGTALRGDGTVREETLLNVVGLFFLLQANGIIADTPDIENAINGTAGAGWVLDSSKLPPARFYPPALRALLAGHKVFVYVLPQAVTMAKVASEFVENLHGDPGVLIAVESTNQRALFNVRTQEWVSAAVPYTE